MRTYLLVGVALLAALCVGNKEKGSGSFSRKRVIKGAEGIKPVVAE